MVDFLDPPMNLAPLMIKKSQNSNLWGFHSESMSVVSVILLWKAWAVFNGRFALISKEGQFLGDEPSPYTTQDVPSLYTTRNLKDEEFYLHLAMASTFRMNLFLLRSPLLCGETYTRYEPGRS